MPTQTRSGVILPGRELVKTSKHLCQASRKRIERGKRMSDDLDECTSWADIVRRKLAHAE